MKIMNQIKVYETVNILWKITVVSTVIAVSSPLILFRGLLDYFDNSVAQSTHKLLDVIKNEMNRLGWHLLTVENNAEFYENIKTDVYMWLGHMFLKFLILFPFLLFFTFGLSFFGIPIIIISVAVINLLVILKTLIIP